MKKSLIALAALAATGAAMAQSSVTLYGVLDTGLTYSKGAESVYGLTHVGGNVNSRLGFRGVEDLGNGLKATFNLEAGIGVDDGTDYFTGAGMAFRRTSTIGLQGDFGAVRLGRMLTSSYLAIGGFDAFGDTGIGGSLAWTAGYQARAQNAISYSSPDLNGLKIGVEYGFGEQVEARDGRYIGVGATYSNGPLSLGLGVDRANNVGANDLTTVHAGAAYDFGAAKVTGFFKQTKYDPTAGGADWKLNSAHLGVIAPVGDAGEVKAGYNYHKVSDGGPKAHQLSLGYVHNLSKRTALYGTYGFLKNKDGVVFGGLTGAMGGAGLDSNGKQHGLQLGMRHAF